MLRLYDYWESGNCYKVRLLLSQLHLPFERVHLDILKGETRTCHPSGFSRSDEPWAGRSRKLLRN